MQVLAKIYFTKLHHFVYVS